jgi:hypothetical protein
MLRQDQVPRRSKHSLLTGHTQHAPIVEIRYTGLPVIMQVLQELSCAGQTQEVLKFILPLSLFLTGGGSTTMFDFKQNQNWLIDYLRFYIPLKKISLIWRRHHCRWRAAKFRPMLGAKGLWAGRDLYRATPAVTLDLFFPGSSEGLRPI